MASRLWTNILRPHVLLLPLSTLPLQFGGRVDRSHLSLFIKMDMPLDLMSLERPLITHTNLDKS